MKIIQIGATYVNFDNLVKFHVGCTDDFREHFFEGVSTGGEFVSVSISKGEAEDLLRKLGDMVDYKVEKEPKSTPMISSVFGKENCNVD